MKEIPPNLNASNGGNKENESTHFLLDPYPLAHHTVAACIELDRIFFQTPIKAPIIGTLAHAGGHDIVSRVQGTRGVLSVRKVRPAKYINTIITGSSIISLELYRNPSYVAVLNVHNRSFHPRELWEKIVELLDDDYDPEDIIPVYWESPEAAELKISKYRG